ncbi:ComEC/Rec2 family competence protein [Orrella sp. 11846]|uniref:ComEC/Rec2 family competence protein n=1 Tax=Orrella sp. 11846 TaxID=3409913 RepID=UPI003B5922E4
MPLAVLALAWLLGLVIAQVQTELLPMPLLLGMAVFALGVLGWSARTGLAQKTETLAITSGLWWLRLISIAVLACAWTGLQGHRDLLRRLPLALDNQTTSAQYVVIGLPVQSGQGFTAQVKALVLIEQGPKVMVDRQVWVTWFDACVRDCAQVIRVGQRWSSRLNWRAPHGHLNFYGDDAQQQLYAKQIYAQARVRGAAKLLAIGLTPTLGSWLEALRAKLIASMQTVLGGKTYAGVLIALVFGDQQGIDTGQWQWFANAGISHLVAISGTHVSLVASLGGLFAGFLFDHLRWHGQAITQRFSRRSVSVLTGLLCALVYCLLAGWGLSARRTFLMLATVSLSLLGRFRLRTSDALGIALFAITVLEPHAILAHGLWLSFTAVLALLAMGLAFQANVKKRRPELLSTQPAQLDQPGHSIQQTSFDQTVWFWCRQKRTDLLAWWRTKQVNRSFLCLLRFQCVLTLATLPLLAWIFPQVSVISVLTNLWAIPWVGAVVTPAALGLAFLSAVVAGFGLPLSSLEPLGQLVHALAVIGFAPVHWLVQTIPSTMDVTQAPIGWVLLSVLGVGLALCLPVGLSRHTAWLLLLPQLCWHPTHPETGGWRLTAFDLGQGESVLIETAQHQVLYDTGWQHGESDAVQNIVLPQLKAMGIRSLDDVVISHPDLDHVGGLATLQKTREIKQLWGSGLHPMVYRACRAGQFWEYDGVQFQMLAPRSDCANHTLEGAQRNRCSCVLRISGRWHSALLPGDIDAQTEKQLVQEVQTTRTTQKTPKRSRHQKKGKGQRKQTAQTRTQNQPAACATHPKQSVRQTSQKSKDKREGIPKVKLKGKHPKPLLEHTSDACEIGQPVPKTDVVLMSHHGSISSSALQWIQALKARHAIAQAGHHNRFGHPHPKVIQRWKEQGVRTWVSAQDGAIEVNSDASGLVVRTARQVRKRYWHDQKPVNALK